MRPAMSQAMALAFVVVVGAGVDVSQGVDDVLVESSAPRPDERFHRDDVEHA